MIFDKRLHDQLVSQQQTIETLREQVLELAAKRDMYRRDYDEEYRIVARIWELLGVTAYTGKSIYDYIRELQQDNARLRTMLETMKVSYE